MADKEINFTLKADDIKITALSLKDGRLELSLSASFDSAEFAQDLLAQLIKKSTNQEPEEKLVLDNSVNKEPETPLAEIKPTAPEFAEPEDNSAPTLAEDNITESNNGAVAPEPEELTDTHRQPKTIIKPDSLPQAISDSDNEKPAPVITPAPAIPVTKSRYGEPESSIEWSAVLHKPEVQPEKSENKLYDEPEDYFSEEEPLSPSDEDNEELITSPESSEQPATDDEAEEVSQCDEGAEKATEDNEPALPEESAPENNTDAEPEQFQKIIDTSDEVPDLPEDIKQDEEELKNIFTPPADDEQIEDKPLTETQEPPANKNYDSSFFHELSPAVNSHLPDDLPPDLGMPEKSPAPYAPDNFSQHPAGNEAEPKAKTRIKFVCPKCHTTGHQNISRLGSVITCENCGRAMRLTLKK